MSDPRPRPWRLPLLAALLGAASVALLLGAEHLHAGAVVGWAVLVAVAAAALWRGEVRRARSEREARESEARLHQAQKMEAVGRLAGGIAHDINNYLAGIRTQCELLQAAARRGDLDPRRTEARLDAVVQTVLKASSLVERLLTFGRRQPGLPEVVDLGDVVETFAAGMGSGLGHGIELEARLAPDLWPVEVDLSQIEQALANLVVNARDAIVQSRRSGDDRGMKGTIVIAARNRPGAGDDPDRVCLTVSDDGPGIPAEIRDRIFDPFFSTKESLGASGLGLATVFAVVDQAGGEIEVESPPEKPAMEGAGAEGRGTTFRVLLPRARRPGRRAPRAASASEGGGERILLIDDEPAVRESTRELLAGRGYRVEAVGGVEAAVAAAGEARRAGSPFDLVVTDVRVGTEAGPDLVARLRREGPVRALYMSGYTDRIVLRSDIDRGDALFLKKPFSGEGLLRMVRQLLDASDRPTG